MIVDAPRETYTAAPLPSLRRTCAHGIDFLYEVYSREHALFPYTSRPLAQGGYASNYAHRASVRYSINSLLGLHEASRAGLLGNREPTIETLVAEFVRLQGLRVDNAADRGLFLHLLVERGMHPELADDLAARIEGDSRDARLEALNMQDLAWMIWGATSAARAGIEPAADGAARLMRIVVERFVDRGTGLPRHSVRRYRRNLVSFGSLVYFLRALHEYGTFTDDREVLRLFRNGVERILALQGPDGEWPWLLNVRSGRIVDPYPVCTVHQDSMAPLFLLPALEHHQIAGSREAITRSLEWVAGRNELELPMIVEQPFCVYRSIERDERVPRLRRYLRAARTVGDWTADFRYAHARLNPECRSYHVGWVLFVWAGRDDWSADSVG